MASLRRLLPLLPRLVNRSGYSPCGASSGHGGSLRRYNAIASSTEQTVPKLEDEYNQGEADNAVDEILKIRREYDAAKKSFLKIPQALKGMPKMNPKGIYVNKNLRLDNIQVYGFDYDYTLAHYSANLQSLIYDLAKEHMVNELRYPESCMEFKYDPTFPIRGLYYDKLKGCLLKLDFFGSIEPHGCYFGRRKNEIQIQNEDPYRFEQAKFHIIQELLGKLHATVGNCQRSEAYVSLLKGLNEERQNTRSVMKRMFNKSFGATFLTDTGQESAFSYHIHQYADVYTSKPENFLFYPPEAWLHVPFDIKIMPHHVKVPSNLFKTE